jgi:hypothetical protein
MKGGTMTPDEMTTEHYAMECRRCNRTWRATYQIRLLHDDAGDHRLYYQQGVLVTAPGSAPCPYCNGQRVTLLPRPVPVS